MEKKNLFHGKLYFGFSSPLLRPPVSFFGLSCSLSDEEKYGESKATWRKSGEGPNEKEREKEKATRFVIIHPRFFFFSTVS